MAVDFSVAFGADSDLVRTFTFNWSSAYELSMWCYHTTAADEQNVCLVFDPTTGRFDILGVHANGRLWIYSESDAGSGYAETPGAVPTATWRYYRLTRASSTSLALYIDNVNTLSHTLNMAGASSGNAEVSLSDDASSRYLRGRLAYARLWSAALSEAQSAAERLSPVALISANLWADWWLQGSTDIVDHSGAGRTLTLTGTLTTQSGPGIAATGMLTPMRGMW